jgi:hypothetical protein
MSRMFYLGLQVSLAALLWISVAAVNPLHGTCARRQSGDVQKTDKLAEDHTRQEVKFEVILQGDGRTEDGIPTYFTSFRCSDGFIVYKTLIDFPSEVRSTKTLEILLKNSLKLLRSTPETDKDGHTVGKRVLILISSKLPDKPTAVVAWTDGRTYIEARSDSLNDLLAFEKRFLTPNKKTVGATPNAGGTQHPL